LSLCARAAATATQWEVGLMLVALEEQLQRWTWVCDRSRASY
jgi:hypothetical protein